MRSAAIIVGFNHWHGDTTNDKTFTRDFVRRLAEHNPDLDILLVDNYSHPKPYPVEIAQNVQVLRLVRRVGYALALNAGLQKMEPKDYDWYVCFNNDCWIDPLHSGNITGILETLNPNVLYGSGENHDRPRKTVMQWSAWLCISREVFRAVGYFDEKLHAAFEDFDYELRAIQAGFTLDTAKFPIIHMDEHTRFEDDGYPQAWEKARVYFHLKHGFETERWFKV
jgi:GT2 family glycosyltransferase